MKFVILCLCSIVIFVAGQRITTIQLDGVQYFVSRMNPYSPELNYFLAYQYCRSLGLQLASFETKEKVESMSQYLKNAGYSEYDFWTSGNCLGTGMLIWMSSGLPFNATFDFFEDSKDAIQAGLLDPLDHNSSTSPQRTARDSRHGIENGCIVLKAPTLRWSPENCLAVKDFICEQTRCYYYNYGSIQVSSSQGRPIQTSTTVLLPPTTTTTFSTPTTHTQTTTPLPYYSQTSTSSSIVAAADNINNNIAKHLSSSSSSSSSSSVYDSIRKDLTTDNSHEEISQQIKENSSSEQNYLDENENERSDDENESEDDSPSQHHEENVSEFVESTTSVEQRLRQISEEIEKYSFSENDGDGVGRKSFLTLSDLIKTLGPPNKKIPQIDSDYSNTMRVLGETSSLVHTADESRKLKDDGLIKSTNHALY